MRARVNNLVLLSSAPGIRSDGALHRSWLFGTGRRLHSDVPSVAPAAVKAEPAAQPRPPLADLLGRRHNYLRISLTERCNLRCKYCMPEEGVPLSARAALLTREELARIVRTFAALGVDKVRLTGGEPTIRRDLADIIQDISQVCGIHSVAITTNGLVLTRRLPALQRAGLSAINVSLDSLRPRRYEEMARRPGLERVLAGIDLALQLGYKPVKINTVLMKGFNDDEICDFVEYTRDREIEVRFIEFMPFSGNKWDDSKMVPHRAALRMVTDKYPDLMPCLPRPHDTARVWQVPGYAGSVGFISSMTQNFCSSCNRLRLTADGNLKVCLFGSSEVSVRDALRSGVSDDQLETLIRAALNNKKPQHAAPLQRTAASARRLATAITTTDSSRPVAFPNTTNLTTLTSASTKLSNSSVTLSSKTTLPKSAVFLVPMLQQTSGRLVRAYSTNADDSDSVLTHLDSEGRARMVDVSEKSVTSRLAEAECSLRVGPRLIRLLRDARLPKGDALTVAQIAGVVGAKRTSDLIPLCHPLPLDCVRVNIKLPKGECVDGGDITIHCEVRATARTGAEMEALTGAAIASLALYDMCKSVDRNMRVMNLRVVRKMGGRSGEWPARAPPAHPVREYNRTPIKKDETYAPTHFMYF